MRTLKSLSLLLLSSPLLFCMDMSMDVQMKKTAGASGAGTASGSSDSDRLSGSKRKQSDRLAISNLDGLPNDLLENIFKRVSSVSLVSPTSKNFNSVNNSILKPLWDKLKLLPVNNFIPNIIVSMNLPEGTEPVYIHFQQIYRTLLGLAGKDIPSTKPAGIDVTNPDFLLALDLEAMSKYPNNLSLMLASAKYGITDIVNRLLTTGVDINATGRDRKTALILAAQNGRTKTVEFLLTQPIKIDAVDNDEYSALVHACRGGYVEMSNALLTAGADINANVDGRCFVTALIVAAESGHIKILNALLDAGADINATNLYGWTALMYAAFKGDTEIVNFLSTAGANINALYVYNNNTALIFAASEGHIETVHALLAAPGVNVNIANNNGWTAIMCAARSGYVETVKALIDKGADVDVSNSYGLTVLMSAAMPEWGTPEEASIATVNALLKANVYIPEDISKFPKVIQVLLEQEKKAREDRRFPVKRDKYYDAMEKESGAGGAGGGEA